MVTYLIQCSRNIQDNPCDCTDNCYRSDQCCFRKIWIKGLSQVSMHFLINLWVFSFLTPFLPCFLLPPIPLHLLLIVSQSLGPFCLLFYLFLPSPSSLALFYLHLPPFLQQSIPTLLTLSEHPPLFSSLSLPALLLSLSYPTPPCFHCLGLAPHLNLKLKTSLWPTFPTLPTLAWHAAYLYFKTPSL